MNEINLEELKVIVPRERVDDVREWAEERLEAATPYEVTSLYLDSPEFEVLEGSYGRSDMTFRVRRYDDGTKIWLERKRRLGTAVSKRRTPWTLGDLPALLTSTVSSASEPAEAFRSEVTRGGFSPRVLVSFHREAWSAPELRVTLDTGVRAGEQSSLLSLDRSATTRPVVPHGAVLELKTSSDERPAIMRQLLDDLGLQVESFSKYAASARALGLAPEGEAHESTV